MSAQLDDVLWQIEELDWMEENEDEDWTEDDWTDEDLVGLDEPEDAEDEPAMSREELEAEQMRLEAELAQMQSEYAATLSDLVAEVQAKIAQGEDFEALIDEYGSDVGMQEEPGLSQGYYVAAGSEMWEQVFTDAALALEKPGDVSEPVVGSNGIHLIRYMACLLYTSIVENVGMVLGLMPVTGIPLPFISYGGSNLLTLSLIHI